MGVQKRSERETLSFMRKSNLLQQNNGNDGAKAQGDEEEDPLDAYMREIEQQAGVPTTQGSNRVAFS